MTGHLQNTCPEAKKANSKKKSNRKQRKGWQFPPPDSEEDESEEEEELVPPESKQPTQEPEVQTEDKTALMDPLRQSKQSDRNGEDMSSGGIKRHHTSETSDSDKDTGTHIAENQIVLATCVPSQGEWRKVEKKKGRKT